MFFLFLSTLSVLIIVLLAIQNKTGRKCRHPPGPKGLPFIGNIHQVDISKPHLWLTNVAAKYGPLISMRLCQQRAVVISSADVAKKALKLNDLAFAGRPHSTTAFRFSYGRNDIICSSYTEYLKQMRKMVVLHLFTPQKVRSFRPVREDEVSRMIHEISNKADSGQLINVGEILTPFLGNLLCRVAFGKRLDEGTGSQRRLFDNIMHQFLQLLVKTFLDDYLPLFGWINKISGVAGEVDNLFKDMDSFYQELINEHLNPNRPESMKNDILDLLIQLRDNDSAPVKIDWEHIKGILMNVLIGATDTNAATIIWALTALMRKPSAMKMVQQEIRSLVGNKRLVDEDDIEKLPYLKAVIKETWRMYPPLPFVPKQTMEKCIIDGYEIEAKTLVFVNTWAIGRDPEYWEKPNEFLPERFLNTTINFKGQDFGFIPFGSGRRICPGMHLGVATVELALANLLYSFDWGIPNGKTEEDIDDDASIGLALHKKNPLCLVAKTYT